MLSLKDKWKPIGENFQVITSNEIDSESAGLNFARLSGDASNHACED